MRHRSRILGCCLLLLHLGCDGGNGGTDAAPDAADAETLDDGAGPDGPDAADGDAHGDVGEVDGGDDEGAETDADADAVRRRVLLVVLQRGPDDDAVYGALAGALTGPFWAEGP